RLPVGAAFAVRYRESMSCAEIIEAIESRRSALNMTKKELAERTGLKAGNVRRLFARRDTRTPNPNLETTFKLLNALDLRFAGTDARDAAGLVVALRKRADELDLSIGTLATSAGLDASSLRKMFEATDPRPTLTTIVDLALALEFALAVVPRVADVRPQAASGAVTSEGPPPSPDPETASARAPETDAPQDRSATDDPRFIADYWARLERDAAVEQVRDILGKNQLRRLLQLPEVEIPVELLERAGLTGDSSPPDDAPVDEAEVNRRRHHWPKDQMWSDAPADPEATESEAPRVDATFVPPPEPDDARERVDYDAILDEPPPDPTDDQPRVKVRPNWRRIGKIALVTLGAGAAVVIGLKIGTSMRAHKPGCPKRSGTRWYKDPRVVLPAGAALLTALGAALSKNRDLQSASIPAALLGTTILVGAIVEDHRQQKSAPNAAPPPEPAPTPSQGEPGILVLLR
ncbi:MAG: helix-turn-helix transcriptional regulator, partial [Myxococcales bacterium]|nr:helix-turn-helix transcriptional regulator [Myxococcales bacterium]